MKRLSFQPLNSGGFILCGGKEVPPAANALTYAGLACIKWYGSTAGQLHYPYIEKADLDKAKAVLRLNGFEVEE